MSDESDLTHAVIALAKAGAENSIILRMLVDRLDDETTSRHETNRILAGIFDQNGRIESLLEKAAVDKRESDRRLRVISSTVKTHGEYLVEVGKKVGLPAPQYEPGRHSAADR